MRAEVELRLDVRARHCEDLPFPELGRHGQVRVARDDPAHLRMSFDDLAEPPPILDGKTDLVECRDPDRKRRVMQGQQRWNARRGCESRL